MRDLFNINGKVYQFLEKISNCLILVILWMLFSLPIFTIGAANAALYYTYHMVVHHSSGKLWHTFWTTFRSNFKQATALWFIELFMLAFLIADCLLCYILSDTCPELKVLLVFFVVAGLFVVMWSQYWFGYICHICDPIKAVLKNTLIMCIRHLSQSIRILVSVAVCAMFIYVLPNGIVLLPFAPTVCLLLIYPPLTRVYSQYWDPNAAIND